MNLAVAIVGAWLLIGGGEAPSEAAVRAAVEKSLPFVIAEGEKWIAEKKCVTCHQVPFMVWSLNAAAERGIELDRQKREQFSSWAVNWKNMATKEDLERGEGHTLARHSDPVAQLLLARGSDRSTLTLALSQREREKNRDALTRMQDQPFASPPAGTLSQRERENIQGTLTLTLSQREREKSGWPAVFAERLAAGQQEDGSWKAGGQLPSQKRPERETQEVSTMWSLVALQSYAAPAEGVVDRFSGARQWLGNETEGQSTEWWAVRLLLERGSGNDKEANRLRGELLARQHEDGGWGWLCADESDAFGTGVALYALARDGMTADESAIARGREFLVQTQQPDGSWLVKGTKKSKAQQVEPTATYWGTCWAVIGMVETMGRGEERGEIRDKR